MERHGSSQYSGKQTRRNVSSGSNSPSSEEQSLQSSQGSQSLQSSQGSNEERSVGAVIAESLAKEGQESIDQALSKINGWFKESTEYVSEKPWEAALMVASFGLTTWLLLTTKPGRKIFDAGAATFVPKISKWMATTFASSTSQATH